MQPQLEGLCITLQARDQCEGHSLQARYSLLGALLLAHSLHLLPGAYQRLRHHLSGMFIPQHLAVLCPPPAYAPDCIPHCTTGLERVAIASAHTQSW